LLAALVALGLAQGVKLARGAHAGTVLAKLESWAQLAGLGLDQVTLIGHRYTADKDIFEAIALKRARTMLSFDPAAAQARLAELPWIEQASLERVFPNRLELRVTERTPVAVWSRGERSFLIDGTGRTLTRVPADVMPELPRVSGEGADSAAAGLFAVLAAFPDLKARIANAERVGGRRWTLRLAGGGAIQLPGEGEAQALTQAAGLLAAGFGRGEIDVRAAGRAIVREPPRASQAQLSAPDRRPTDRL
jgi:cell division protein FtsQ